MPADSPSEIVDLQPDKLIAFEVASKKQVDTSAE